MKELIRIESREIGSSVSARELYIGLGLNAVNWSRWSKENIDKNTFFSNGVDFIELFIMKSRENPNPPKDYAISIEFAKHIAMQARTDKSHLYRQYMIDCENKCKATQQLQVPQTFSEALKLAYEQSVVIERQQKVIEEKDHSIANKDQLIVASNEASIKAGEILVREFVKSNDLIDLGEKQFYEWMREQGILLKNGREPDQKYVKRGYFTYKPSEEMYGGKFRHTLRITPRGKVWLAGKYLAYLDSEVTA
ncbi:MAG: antA/AntB antirepressor family protein [Methylobacter sp.]|jgi:phage anti-repressor protein|nr:antA/AntB antirepressor family protein [Methylobacter sp.]